MYYADTLSDDRCLNLTSMWTAHIQNFRSRYVFKILPYNFYKFFCNIKRSLMIFEKLPREFVPTRPNTIINATRRNIYWSKSSD